MGLFTIKILDLFGNNKENNENYFEFFEDHQNEKLNMNHLTF